MGSRAFILNGDLKDTSITFNGVETFNNEKPRNYPIDAKGLTGCLSLINVRGKDLKILASNAVGGAVNIINSKYKEIIYK